MDYIGAAEAARRTINAWVSDQTEQRIPELLAQGVVDDMTRLVLVNAIYFLDLFKARNGATLEVGQATINGGSAISVSATDIAGSGAGGFAAALFAPIYATVIRFTVLSSNDNFGFADGALAGIGIAPIPVPAAGALLLGGLGGLAVLRRRKKT